MILGSGVVVGSALGLLALAASLSGCAGKSASNDEDGGGRAGTTGGTGTTGGQGGSGAQGGTGAQGGSPQVPRLGLYLMIRNPDPSLPQAAGRSCPASTGVEWDIGAPIFSNGVVVGVDSPSSTDFGRTVASGTENTSVRCSVTPTGVFDVEAAGVDPMIAPPNGVISFTLRGQTSLRGGTNLDAFDVYTPLTLALTMDDTMPACWISGVNEVAPGALWADFECPLLVGDAPNAGCAATATIVVEYCLTN